MRVLSLFSCGAASAVATKLAIAENNKNYDLPLEIIYTEVIQEHNDNKRFLKECEQWFSIPVTILRNEKYSASTYEVPLETRFIVSRGGAPCTLLLKKKLEKNIKN